MIKLIGKKLGMTSLFTKEGKLVPATLVEVGPCPVVQVKTIERDGYVAVQIGLADGKKNPSKPLAGHFKKAGVQAMRYLAEVRDDKHELGQVLTVADLNLAAMVKVTGKTKGRGFAGGMKRHGFRGECSSHGVEKRHRTPGSLQGGARLTHVWKGKNMAGHMGNVNCAVRNLSILRIEKEKNIVILKGSIPGHSGAMVFLEQK